MITKDDENIVMVPLCWLTREQRKEFIRVGYEVIPISGYQETIGFRAFKIIGIYSNTNWWIKDLSIPIWEDWKLTAKYANDIQIHHSTNAQQMFDHLDDDEKIQALKYWWSDPDTTKYIQTYFARLS